MTTDLQVDANRRNAQRSTGPRSQAGTTRASRNALRHGFASKTRVLDSESVDRLAEKIAGPNASRDRFELARQAAEAELRTSEIFEAKNQLLSQLINSDPQSDEHGHCSGEAGTNIPVNRSGAFREVVRSTLSALRILDRYASRAAARRDAALIRLRRSGP